MASAAEVRDRTMCALLLVLCCKQTADWCDRRAARVSVDITEPATSTHRRQRSNFVSPSPPQRQQYQLEEVSSLSVEDVSRLQVFEISDNSTSGDVCSICFENLHRGDAAIRLECSHEYHQHCLTNWLLRKAECPTCRTGVSKSSPQAQA